MRNWLREIRNWLATRFARLVKQINVGMVEENPSAQRATSPSIDEFNFQASTLRKKRPIASTVSRQSITIPVPPRAKPSADESGPNEKAAVPSYENAQQPETTIAHAQVEPAEAEATEPIETEIEVESESADVEMQDVEGDRVEDEAVPQSETAHTLAELAAIQATQSEAIFTVRNAEDGSIDVQVRGETMSLAAALESLLFVSDTSVEITQFVKLFSLDPAVIEAELGKLGEQFKQSGRGIRLQEQNGRYRLISVPAAANLIETFLNLDLTTRLSGPALETLSVIAYRQPVTRAQIEAVRGVDCGYVLRSLLQRGLIEESGRLETVGRPILYSVTEQFMQHFGLTTLNDLPPLENTEAALLMQVTEMEVAENQ